MPSLSALRSRVAALPGTARLVEALARALGGGRRGGTRRSPPHPRVGPGADPHRGARCSPSPPPVARPRTCTPRSQSSLGAEAVALFPSWETLPHERLSPRSDTVGQRLSVLRRLAHPDDRRRRPTGRSRSSSRRCARCSSRIVQGPGRPRSRSRCRPATTCRSSRSSRPWRPPPTPAPTSSSGAASSRCAAASSTSSRRPRSTRCASSSSATRSRRSAGSRSPTSARSRCAGTACGRRRAASCC